MKTRTTSRKGQKRTRVETRSQSKARVRKHQLRHIALKCSEKGALPLLVIASLTVLIFMTVAAAVSRAEMQVDLSSKSPKKSVPELIRETAQSCFDRELALWEAERGRLPTDEEADLIIDACVNPKLK